MLQTIAPRSCPSPVRPVSGSEHDCRCNACRCARWYANNRERQLANVRAYAVKHADRKHARRVEYRYGISQNDYQRLLEFQDFRCAICGVHQNDLPRRLALDHDHQSGEPRGCLCAMCNVAVGSAERHGTGAFSYYLSHPPMKEMRFLAAHPDAPRPA